MAEPEQGGAVGQKPPFEEILTDLGRVSTQIDAVDRGLGGMRSALEAATVGRAELASERDGLLEAALDNVQARLASGELDEENAIYALWGINAGVGNTLSEAIVFGIELRKNLAVGQPVLGYGSSEVEKITTPPEGEKEFTPTINRNQRVGLVLGYLVWLDGQGDALQQANLTDRDYIGAEAIKERLDRLAGAYDNDRWSLSPHDKFTHATRIARNYRAIGCEEEAANFDRIAIASAIETIQNIDPSNASSSSEAMAYLIKNSPEDMRAMYDHQAEELARYGLRKENLVRSAEFAEDYTRATSPDWRYMLNRQRNYLVITTLEKMNQRGNELLAIEAARREQEATDVEI